MNILKNTKKGFIIISTIAISNKLAESFEYCGSLKKMAILKTFPLFDKFEIKNDVYNGKNQKNIVVTSKEIRSLDINSINKLSKIQNKVIKAIIKKEAASIIIDGAIGEMANQLVKIDKTKKVLSCLKTEASVSAKSNTSK
jgi:hypothetical protein